MLGLASRQLEAALSGAGIMKSGRRRECSTEKEREPAKDKPSNPKRVGSPRDPRRKLDDTQEQGGPAPVLQPDILSPMILL